MRLKFLSLLLVFSVGAYALDTSPSINGSGLNLTPVSVAASGAITAASIVLGGTALTGGSLITNNGRYMAGQSASGYNSIVFNSAGANYGVIGPWTSTGFALGHSNGVGGTNTADVYWNTSGGLVVIGSATIQGATNFPGIAFSSAGVTGTSTATSLFVCQSGSTITWTSNGNRAEFSYSGDIANSSLASNNALYLLIDGALQFGGAGLIYFQEAVATDVTQITGTANLILSSGVHSACLAPRVSAGTMTLGANTQSEFHVREF